MSARQRPALFIRGLVPSLGLPDNFGKLEEAEQLKLLTRSVGKLKDQQRLAAAAQLDPLMKSRARQGMASYIHYMGLGFRPAAHHQLLIDGLEAITRGELDRLMVFMPPGSAKALTLDTPIATPDGWSTMGELEVGDRVFDERGKPCYVIRKSPVWKDRPVYRVTTDCGDTIIADEDHEWLIRLCGKRPVFKLKQTKYLAKPRTKRAMTVRGQALNLPERHLPVDPYVLGVWLGDGSSQTSTMTAGEQDRDWFRREIENLGYKTTDRVPESNFGIAGIRGDLAEMGVLNDPWHNTRGGKHIPAEYLRASARQRFSLLQGLIDTDGHVAAHGEVQFGSTNARLASGVAELVRSLGAKASISEGRAKLYGRDCGPVWRVHFFMKDAARLPRKRERTKDGTRTPNTYLSAEPFGRADTVCIEVDSPSHLFLAGVSMTPTHNSTYTSVVFPAWYLGKNPTNSMIAASHTEELTSRFGRRARNLFASPQHQAVFGMGVAKDSGAAGRWDTARGGEYYAVGFNGSVTGRRADVLIIDDPTKGREEADSQRIRDKTWDIYINDLLTRLKPEGRQVVVSCLTGDTAVTMADGSYLPISEIRPGDEVLTRDGDQIVTRRVLNWKPQDEDDILEIRTGNSAVKANARHPFMVARGEEFVWVKAGELTTNDYLVTLAHIPGREQSILRDDQAWLLGYMFGDGWITVRDTVQSGYKGRTYPRRGYVTCIATSAHSHHNLALASAFEASFGFVPKLTRYGYSRTDVAAVGRWFVHHGLSGNAHTKRLPRFLFSEPEQTRLAFLEGFADADGHARDPAPKRKGKWGYGKAKYLRQKISSCNLGLIEDLRQLARGVGFRVTNTFRREFVGNAPSSPKPTQSVHFSVAWQDYQTCGAYSFSRIRSIKPAGRAVVYDIEVEDTETFFADGLLVHNTRWHEDDLCGRILQMEGDRWKLIKLPMEAGANDVLGRKPGERLWPEWFTAEMVADAKRDARAWNALYQQEPAGEDGDYFKREWFRDYEIAPANLRIYAASDYAVTERAGDFTEHAIFGIDGNRNLYILDWWSGQESADKWIERQCDLIQKWKPSCWFGEAGPIRRSIEPFLLKRMDERSAYCRLEWLPSIHDKGTRCRAFQAMTANGKVWLPKRGAEWRSDVIGQLLRFPAGMYDDKVDACSLIGRGLEHINVPDNIDNVINLQTRYNVGYASAKRRFGTMHIRRGAAHG